MTSARSSRVASLDYSKACCLVRASLPVQQCDTHLTACVLQDVSESTLFMSPHTALWCDAGLQAVWRQLLVCRRSELMCCIPLTSQRISQLQSIAAAAAVTAGQLIQALQSGLSTLTAFATVNKSTAEELQHDPGTAALVSTSTVSCRVYK